MKGTGRKYTPKIPDWFKEELRKEGIIYKKPAHFKNMCRWLGGFRLERNDSCDVSKSWWERHGVRVLNVADMTSDEEYEGKVMCAYVAINVVLLALLIVGIWALFYLPPLCLPRVCN